MINFRLMKKSKQKSIRQGGVEHTCQTNSFATRILVEGKCFSSNLISSVPNKAKRSVEKEGGKALLISKS